MDPETVKTALALGKSAGTAAGLSIPFTGIVKRMLGPAADEVAEMWRDQVRVYRYGRQIKLLEKAEKMAADAGFTPQPVPPKILFPLLEGASFEDNEDLHTMWAGLLANASDPNHQDGTIQPAYIELLRQLTFDQAIFLDALFSHTLTKSNELRKGVQADPRLPDPTLLTIYPVSSPTELFALYCRALKIDVSQCAPLPDSNILWRRRFRRQYRLALDNLFRLRLLRERLSAEVPTLDEGSEERVLAEYFYIASSSRMFYFSTLGFEFIAACRPPKSDG